MILSCPSCSMRYLVADSAIPVGGRRVRCASCHHEWHEAGPEPETFEEILEKEAAQPPVEPIPEAVRPIPEGSGVPARPEDIPPPEKDHSVLIGRLTGYAAAAAVCLMIVGALVALRTPIAAAWPPSLLFYDLVGAKVALPGEGLIIDRVKATAENNSLIVRGSIINLKSDDIAVPRILATLWREDGSAMESWIIDLPHDEIKAEASFDFEAEYPGVPSEATSVNLSFAAFIGKPAPEKMPAPMHVKDDAHTPAAPDAAEASASEAPAPEVQTPEAQTPEAQSSEPAAADEQAPPPAPTSIDEYSDDHPADIPADEENH